MDFLSYNPTTVEGILLVLLGVVTFFLLDLYSGGVTNLSKFDWNKWWLNNQLKTILSFLFMTAVYLGFIFSGEYTVQDCVSIGFISEAFSKLVTKPQTKKKIAKYEDSL